MAQKTEEEKTIETPVTPAKREKTKDTTERAPSCSCAMHLRWFANLRSSGMLRDVVDAGTGDSKTPEPGLTTFDAQAFIVRNWHRRIELGALLVTTS